MDLGDVRIECFSPLIVLATVLGRWIVARLLT